MFGRRCRAEDSRHTNARGGGLYAADAHNALWFLLNPCEAFDVYLGWTINNREFTLFASPPASIVPRNEPAADFELSGRVFSSIRITCSPGGRSPKINCPDR